MELCMSFWQLWQLWQLKGCLLGTFLFRGVTACGKTATANTQESDKSRVVQRSRILGCAWSEREPAQRDTDRCDPCHAICGAIRRSKLFCEVAPFINPVSRFDAQMGFTMERSRLVFSHRVRELQSMSESEVTLTEPPIPDPGHNLLWGRAIEY